MAHIKNEVEYNAAMERIEELLLVVNQETPESDRNSIELVLLSNLVADYDETHYPISSPTLADVLKLRMYEMGLTQKKIAEMLGVSPSRITPTAYKGTTLTLSKLLKFSEEHLIPNFQDFSLIGRRAQI